MNDILIIANPASGKYKIIKPLLHKIIDILQSSFSNGFRVSSPIEMLRFRSFYENHFEHEIELDDNDIKLYIKKSGVLFDEKVYIVSSETKRKLFEEVEHYFESGNQIIFYEEFYYFILKIKEDL